MGDESIRPRCPKARAVQGATPDLAGVICGVMEEDNNRRDSILEGGRIGEYVTIRDDPRTLAYFCCGTAPASPNPTTDLVAHYTSCPTYQAGLEIDDVLAEERRVYGGWKDPRRTEGEPTPGVSAGPQEFTAAERMALGLDG